MKVIGIGTDIVEISRIRNAKYMMRVAEYICTNSELKNLERSRDSAQYLASTLAAKEAVIKAFPYTLTYQDFMIIRSGKKPCVEFTNTQHPEYRIYMTLAHEFTFAISNAMVCENV